MSDTTKIEWTDKTWNPWEGCTKVSPGCANCYAEAMNHRFKKDNWGKGKPRRRTKDWSKPARWNRDLICDACGEAGPATPVMLRDLKCYQCGQRTMRLRRVFPSIMDWLDDEVPIEWFADFLRLIYDTPNLDWLLLTKRPENWRNRINQAALHLNNGAVPTQGWAKTLDWREGRPPANVWVGFSAENAECLWRRWGDAKIIPAKQYFISLEPLLGDVAGTLNTVLTEAGALGKPVWCIFGGESGPGARPCHVEWVRDLVRQGRYAGVPVFVKQLGAFVIEDHCMCPGTLDGGPDCKQCAARRFLCHPKGGDPAEWPEDLRVRDFPLSENQ